MKPRHLTFTLLIVLLLSQRLTSQIQNEIKAGTITNLYDAFGKDSTLTKDFGFSCITRYAGKTILFDAGSHAGIFKDNVDKLGLDLSTVDIVIVSHGHFDHINGLDQVLKVNPHVKIYFPYDIFWGAPVPYDATGQEANVKDSLPTYMQYFDGGNTKFSINQSGRFWGANIEFVKTSREILPGLTIIASSSKFMGYFSCYPGKSFVPGQFEQNSESCKNINLPELSLAMKTEKGQVLIVGCSHTGVENIVSQTLNTTHDIVDLLYGGFHLLPFDRDQTINIARVLKSTHMVKRVAPAHCTGHLAFKIFHDLYQEDYLFAGLGETITYE
ncbi:MAG: MBL fold metallo-hydrolase [Saprospiraceae bacterium]|nr:MBL fold metallo-hydrolase [Saprospiraceae bacterium]